MMRLNNNGGTTAQALHILPLRMLAVGLLAGALLLGGCNKGAKGTTQAPGTPPQPAHGAAELGSIPADVAKHLPLDANWEIKTFSEDKTAYFITAQSDAGAMETSAFLLKWLGEGGYENADNPSRILEGTEFTGGRGRFKRVFIKSSLDADSRSIIEITAYK